MQSKMTPRQGGSFFSSCFFSVIWKLLDFHVEKSKILYDKSRWRQKETPQNGERLAG